MFLDSNALGKNNLSYFLVCSANDHSGQEIVYVCNLGMYLITSIVSTIESWVMHYANRAGTLGTTAVGSDLTEVPNKSLTSFGQLEEFD